jgi:hypothetical protein
VYPFLIVPPVVFNVYLIPAVYPVYPFLIAPPVFFYVYLIPADVKDNRRDNQEWVHRKDCWN